MRVEYMDHMGSCLSIANAARVSMDKQHTAFDEETDSRLLRYLAQHQHWTPFAHTALTLRITTPIFVARQLAKHQVGLVWNEISRRYVDAEPEFYAPAKWRSRPAGNIKQGSGEPITTDAAYLDWIYREGIYASRKAYDELLARGVAPEMARMVMPQSMMTTWIWTGSLAAFARVCTLRLDSHAQAETREIAVQISDICAAHFPAAWSALMSTK